MATRKGPPEPSRVLVDARTAAGRRLRHKVARDAQRFLDQLEIAGRELSVLLVGDRAIRTLNLSWRRIDKATDVLSFPAGEVPPGFPGPRPLGDVVISVETAARVAKAEGRRVEAEVARYLAHGILHLQGLDHERSAREARKMASLEQWLLGEQGLIPGRGRLTSHTAGNKASGHERSSRRHRR